MYEKRFLFCSFVMIILLSFVQISLSFVQVQLNSICIRSMQKQTWGQSTGLAIALACFGVKGPTERESLCWPQDGATFLSQVLTPRPPLPGDKSSQHMQSKPCKTTQAGSSRISTALPKIEKVTSVVVKDGCQFRFPKVAAASRSGISVSQLYKRTALCLSN